MLFVHFLNTSLMTLVAWLQNVIFINKNRQEILYLQKHRVTRIRVTYILYLRVVLGTRHVIQKASTLRIQSNLRFHEALAYLSRELFNSSQAMFYLLLFKV